MDPNVVYALTPIGEEAVRQSTRVVQRNLRMVLVQVDGKLTGEELALKVGNFKLVENALEELEREGYVVSVRETASFWKESKRIASGLASAATFRFSPFTKPPPLPEHSQVPNSQASGFSVFGKPILPSQFGSEPTFSPKVESEEAFEPPPRRYTKYLLACLLAVLLLVPFIYPYGEFKPRIQSALIHVFQASVQVEAVDVSFSPLPVLKIEGVTVGEKGTLAIAAIEVPVTPSLLLPGRAVLPKVLLRGVRAPVDRLAKLRLLTQGLGSEDSSFLVRRAEIKGLSSSMRDRVISGLSGEVIFSSEGKLEKLALTDEGHHIDLQALPTSQGLALQIEGNGWKVFGEPAYVFDSMTVSALLQPGKLLVQEIDAIGFGGRLKGSGQLDWRQEFSMAGDGTLIGLSAPKLLKALAMGLKIEGELSGTGRWHGVASHWSALWKNVEGQFNGEATRGVLHDVDLGDITRRGAGGSPPGAFTRFDRLTGQLQFGKDATSVHNLTLEAGLLSATGQGAKGPEGRMKLDLEIRLQSQGAGRMVQGAPVRVSLPWAGASR